MEKAEGKIIVELQDWMGDDRAIANAAWTSSFNLQTREDKSEEQVENLVGRLANDGHATPFESVVLRFWIRLPIFIDRQHMTHRIASHNGLSGRYRTMPEDYFPFPEDCQDIASKAGFANMPLYYERLLTQQQLFYKDFLEELKKSEKKGDITNAEYKRVREVWRGVLGTSFMVERTTVMNLRSFANYQCLRNTEHAQPEIRQVAELMLAEVKSKSVAPIAVKALEDKGWRL